ncbi:MAG TPA: hypothetical protein VGD63_14555 [Steroidobacteraceae bacterium]
MKAWCAAGLALSMHFAGAPAQRAHSSHAHSPDRLYSIVASIPGPDGMWDYAAVSSQEQRLYLAQGEYISILDLAAQSWARTGLPGAMWHGVAPLESRGLVLGTNGQAHALTLFDAKSRAAVSSITTSSGTKSALFGKLAKFAVLADPDALVIEPKTGLAAAVNGGSGEVVFVDLDKQTVVGRVMVGGKLEFAVTDGRGRLYVNVQTAHEIAVIDVPTFKLVRRIPLSGCTEPKGLAYDAKLDLLISGCDNGVAKFILAEKAEVVGTLAVGRSSDAVLVDEQRHRAFVPSGDDATLSIFDIHDPHRVVLMQTLRTEKGARLGAVDPQTGRVYLPSAKLGHPIPPRPWPSATPGSFHVLVIDLPSGS